MGATIGIVGPYYQCEVTRVALQIARRLRSDGHRVRYFARRAFDQTVDPEWDTRVGFQRLEDFYPVGSMCDTLVWLEWPSTQELELMTDAGATNVLFPVWEDFGRYDMTQACAFDHIIIPFNSVGFALQRQWPSIASKFVALPWVVDAPLAPLRSPPARPAVFVPMHDTQSDRIDTTIFVLANKILGSQLASKLLITSAKHWGRDSFKQLQELKKHYGGKVLHYHNPTQTERLHCIAQADLMLWLTQVESLALDGLYAWSMGCPVVAWDLRPHSEYLYSDINAVLYPCHTKKGLWGQPMCDDCCTNVLSNVCELLSTGQEFGQIGMQAYESYQARKQRFLLGWNSLFG